MKIDKKTYTVIIAVLLLISLVSIFLFVEKSFKYESLSSDFQELSSEYNVYRNESSEELSHERETNEQLTKSYEDLKSEVNAIISEIDDYRATIQDSLDWFSFNSDVMNIENDYQRDQIETFLNARCYETLFQRCVINTGCINLVNYNNLNLYYKYDNETTGKEDKLVTLEEIVENHGGDCEDFSLLYKAEMNYFLDHICEDMEITIESWIDYDNGMFYLDNKDNWFFEDAKSIKFQDGFIYPNVICGNIYDLNIGDVSGHCIIALTKNKISKISDIENELDNAILIEPQDGGYMGRVNDPSSGMYILNENNINYAPESYIYMVISDNDLFMVDFDTGKWTSYSEFDDNLVQYRSELSSYG